MTTSGGSLRWLSGVLVVLGAAAACSAPSAAPRESGTSGGSSGAAGGSGATGGASGTAGNAGDGGSSAFGGFGGFGGTSGSGGTAGLDPDAACTGIREEAEKGFAPADVIVAVDTSGSMSEEAQWTQNAMPNFANIISSSGIDIHVVMISSNDICVPAPLGSGSCPADSKPPSYLHVQQGVGSNDALQKIISTYPQWSSMLRPNATKAFVVVTDDDSDMSAAAFTSAVNALDPTLIQPNQWVFHGIFASQPPFLAPCFLLSAAAGTVYAQLVIQTSGISGDLCLQNFTPVFQQLATAVVSASPLACEWDIPPPPSGSVDPNLVNVIFTGSGSQTKLGYVDSLAACTGAQNGWYYDDNTTPTKIFACPDTCNLIRGAGAVSVEVQLGCATEVAPPK